MHSAGTTIGTTFIPFTSKPKLLQKIGESLTTTHVLIEGSWDECMTIIGQCHSLVHANGVVRIQSDIRVGTRTDKKQGFEDKVKAVEDLLAQDEKS